MEEKQVRLKKRAFVALLFPALLFFLVSPFAVPASALTYELGSPSLFEYYDAGYYGFSFFACSSSGNVVTYDLDDVLTGLGFWFNPGRVPLVDNIPSDIAMSYHLDSYFANNYLVEDSSYTGETDILFTDYEMIGRIDLSTNCALSAFRFIYPKISFTQSMSEKVFKLNYSFDYYDRFAEDDSSYLALKSLFNELVSPALLVSGSPEVPPFVAPASSVVVTKTAERSYNMTAYFDFTIGDLFSALGSGTYTDFQPIVTLPNIFTWSSAARAFRIKQHVHFPTEYELIAGGAYGAEIDAINEQLDDIRVSISDQSTVIISGISDVIQDQLIDNTDPERQAINQEAETNIDRLKDVGDEYESQNAIVDEARRNLESIVPVTLPPEASEFISTTGEILSSPWILTLTTIGLTLGIIRIILIGVYH